jgi:hypothetical protein
VERETVCEIGDYTVKLRLSHPDSPAEAGLKAKKRHLIVQAALFSMLFDDAAQGGLSISSSDG